MRRHLDRARVGRRRPRDCGRARPVARAARPAANTRCGACGSRKEEEEGYYYGFANEGLWPLCHIAHTRPIFRASDWQSYQAANRKFADAVLEEIEGDGTRRCVLVQDYHFALLPRMIKDARPDARVAIFWHIPWPNPEAFGICPWQRELLDGLLGADLVGFHTQAHCNNFLETVDARSNRESSGSALPSSGAGTLTCVRPFPISVDFRGIASRNRRRSAVAATSCARRCCKNLGIEASFLGVGVDRIDYTKGIIERFRGVERFLEKCPAYRGRIHVRADRRAEPHEHSALSRLCWLKWRRRRRASMRAFRQATGSRSRC